ncbi:hypothetical protein [Actinopolymorpha pittospori]
MAATSVWRDGSTAAVAYQENPNLVTSSNGETEGMGGDRAHDRQPEPEPEPGAAVTARLDDARPTIR